MLAKNLPLTLSISALTGAVISYFVLSLSLHPTAKVTPRPPDPCNLKIVRLAGYHYIHPVLYADRQCESADLSGIKQQITDLVDSRETSGDIIGASVYLRLLSTGDWIEVNPDSAYHPASLNKVPIMITYLHKAEDDPTLLGKKIFYKSHNPALPLATIQSKTLEPGTYYTINELLQRLIAYSDNDAFALLMDNLGRTDGSLMKTFSDVGLEKPGPPNVYTITARDYSVFFEVLYNSSYLSPTLSEYAMLLLTQSDFKEGLVRQLPAGIKVAHKFGESNDGHQFELHESGIVFQDGNPYIITIMTKGTDNHKLAAMISDISNLVYTSELSRNTRPAIAAVNN